MDEDDDEMTIRLILLLSIDALQTIVREEGIAGLYKGLLPGLLLTSHGAIQVSSNSLLACSQSPRSKCVRRID